MGRSALGGASVVAALCFSIVSCSGEGSGNTTADGGDSTNGAGGATSGGGGAHNSAGGSSLGGRTASGAGGRTASGAGGRTAGSSGGDKSTGGGGTSAGAGGATATGNTGGSTAMGTGGSTTSTGATPAAAVAAKLGKTHFLIGMGNDLNNNHDMDGAYTLGVTLDVHYAYLSGLMGSGGWPDWNAGGAFVNDLANAAKRHNVVPLMTLYGMAARPGVSTATLTDDSYMKPYWDGAKLMFQRLGVFGDPSMVQFEPDWWAFAEQGSPGGDPSKVPAHVTSLAPDCASQPDTLVGMGKCLVALGRKYAPKALLGFHTSSWADGDPAKIVAFLSKIGATDADFVTTDMLDRDAGCFEAHTDAQCQRNDGPWYWDETNKTSPNFHDNLAWVKKITDGLGKPMLWWQVPFGVPSSTPGGTSGHYRDNRVHYIFSHIDEFVAAGGLGAVFGTGAGNQTYIDTDGGQFKDAVTKYFAAPVPL